MSKEARDAFREQFIQEFAELDQRCETLTEKEVYLGDFESFSTHRWLAED